MIGDDGSLIIVAAKNFKNSAGELVQGIRFVMHSKILALRRKTGRWVKTSNAYDDNLLAWKNFCQSKEP